MRSPHPVQCQPAKPRSVAIETLLQLWGTVSLISLFAILYYGYVVLDLAFSTGYLNHVGMGMIPPPELAEAAIIQMALVLNYAIFKSRYRVVIGRAGIGAVLRSTDPEK